MAPPSGCSFSFSHRHFPPWKRWWQETGGPRQVPGGGRGQTTGPPCTHAETLDKLLHTTKPIHQKGLWRLLICPQLRTPRTQGCLEMPGRCDMCPGSRCKGAGEGATSCTGWSWRGGFQSQGNQMRSQSHPHQPPTPAPGASESSGQPLPSPPSPHCLHHPPSPQPDCQLLLLPQTPNTARVDTKAEGQLGFTSQPQGCPSLGAWGPSPRSTPLHPFKAHTAETPTGQPCLGAGDSLYWSSQQAFFHLPSLSPRPPATGLSSCSPRPTI